MNKRIERAFYHMFFTLASKHLSMIVDNIISGHTEDTFDNNLNVFYLVYSAKKSKLLSSRVNVITKLAAHCSGKL